MELTEVKKRLKTLGIPVAYYKFNTPQKLPFIVWHEDGARIEGADKMNLYRRVDIAIDLYSEKKELSIEKQIEDLFSDIPLDKTPDIDIPEENMFMTTYTFETIQKIAGG